VEQRIRELERRLSGIEEESRKGIRFFVQYLLSPIMVVAIGLMVNLKIEQDRKELQEVKIVQSMLSTLFSDDEFKIMATRRLMDKVLQDKALKIELGSIISDYMNSKFVTSAKTGDYEKAVRVYQAVKAVGGDIGEEIAKNIIAKDGAASVFSVYETAKTNEQQGFSALVAGDYNLAIEKFKKAYEVYPQYHSVSEIYNLLLTNIDNMDDEKTKNEVIKKIVEDLSWKAPPESISRLRTRY
jgi:tetratricopeptide (TPR) repeat protein